jgi:hypothetical protein
VDPRNLGDRWLAGDAVPGVDLARHATVFIAGGPFAGCVGSIALLLTPPPDPLYLVELRGDPGGEVRVRQSSLQRVV